MEYKHRIEVSEKATSFPSPVTTEYGIQVVFGTAPVNLAEDPYAVANRPIRAGSFEDAETVLGYSDNWDKYTLCMSMYACFQVFQVNPVIFINVLDPTVHVKELEAADYPVEGHQAVIETEGILMDQVKITAQTDAAKVGTAQIGTAKVASEAAALKEGTDYVMDFDEYGHLVVTLLSGGSAYEVDSINLSAKVIAPELVTESDIIGAYDAETGKESGLEVLRQVYPRLGCIPSILLAPGWTEKPNIGAALQEKCVNINGSFKAVCLLDLDTELAGKYTDCGEAKEEMGYDGEHAIVLWPKVIKDGRIFCYSAVYGAMMSYNTSENQDVPYLYPSNKDLNVDGTVLADGSEILLDQVQAGNVNGEGVVTAICDMTWKSFGNNTACFPGNTDPKDRWIGCRRMFDFAGNYFVRENSGRLDDNMNRRLVDDIINSFNIWGNSLVADGMCAGLYAEYREEDNTQEDILSGHIKVRIFMAPYTPAEYINATMEFDVTALQNAMVQEG